MDRELLYNFFKGNATLEEGMKIKAWVEASEENERTFYKERELFNTLLLHNPLPEKKSSVFKLSIFKKIKSDGLKIAVVVILTLAFSYLYQGYKNRRADVIMSTISVPEGQRTHLTLPDGTTVWLNARTTIQYPSSFNKKKRVVILQGEAYFDVKRNEDKPFVVQTSFCDVEVLGTKFNVNNYDTSDSQVVLVQGAVELKTTNNDRVRMKPNELVSLQEGSFAEKRAVNTDEYTCWMQGMINLDGESVESVAQRLSHYYGVTILFDDGMSADKFYGKLMLGDRVSEALQSIETMTQTRMEIHGDTIYLVKK